MSEPLSAERLAEIRARCQKAMDGPWTLSDDIEFTVTAMRDIPDLLAEIDGVRAENARLHAERLPVHNHGTEDAAGLACREHALVDGSRLGECMLLPRPASGLSRRFTPAHAEESTCSWGVVRGGTYEPCDKPAVAWSYNPPDEEPCNPFPVCARHTYRAVAIPLDDPRRPDYV